MTPDSVVVLLAEDEPLASMALQAQVEALGHTVAAVARNGREAADLARCLPVDLAVFDMKMPGLTGLDAALRIFPEAPTPVLLLTGFGAADLPDPVPRPPIFSILTKPIGLAELRTGIDDARAAFQEWVAEDEQRTRDIRDARDRRLDIEAALSRNRGDDSIADAAARFLTRADDAGVGPAELARRILRDDDGA